MHTIYIHIDENLDEAGMRSISDDLKGVNHIVDVEINARAPHDMLVDVLRDKNSPYEDWEPQVRFGVGVGL